LRAQQLLPNNVLLFSVEIEEKIFEKKNEVLLFSVLCMEGKNRIESTQSFGIGSMAHCYLLSTNSMKRIKLQI